MHKTRKGKCACPSGCTCLREQLVAGGVPITELLGVLTKEVRERPFVARLPRLYRHQLPIFETGDYQIRFEAAYRENMTGSVGQTAAVFLLTFLEQGTDGGNAGEYQLFDYPHSRYGLGWLCLFHRAKDLCTGTKHISLSDLTDPELVSDSAFRLLVTDFLIRRYGAEALCAERSS